MELRAFIAARAAASVCVAVLTSTVVSAQTASDPARVVHPSVEELARPDLQTTGTAVDGDTRQAICLMVESAARASDLPLEFFARVIWQESRFQSDAVGPVTRRGGRAEGIAQFMPGTASE